MIAVPANNPNPVCVKPSAWPIHGKMKTATTLKRKTVEIAYAISWSSASTMGETAAIAEPPQIAVPTPMRLLRLNPTLSNLPATNTAPNAAVMVTRIITTEATPVTYTWRRLSPLPRIITAHCNIFLDVKFIPSVNVDFGGAIFPMPMPRRIPKIAPPINGKLFPNKYATMATESEKTIPR